MADLLKRTALENAEKKMTEILEALEKNPSDPKKVAQEFGLEWKNLDPVSRTTGFVPELGKSHW